MADITDKLKEANQPNKELVVGYRADKGITPEEDFYPPQGPISKEDVAEEEDPIPGSDNLW